VAIPGTVVKLHELLAARAKSDSRTIAFASASLVNPKRAFAFRIPVHKCVSWAFIPLGFEDDPFLFDYAAHLSNPLLAFTDPDVLRHFTVGKALVPMQIVSYWIDVHWAGLLPALAYVHQTISLLLTLLLLYLVLIPIVQHDQLAASVICILWILLPATSVVLQFLATRHYLEGMLFFLLTAYVMQRFRSPTGELHWAARTSALSAACMSVLCKEVYLPVVVAVLVEDAWLHRDRWQGTLTAAMLVSYGTYRLVMVGQGIDYTIPFLNTAQYLKFLAKIPFTISSNYGGYCVLAMVIGVCITYTRRSENSYRAILWFAAVIALSLAVINQCPFRSMERFGRRVHGTELSSC
jgi:hypothetical protein